MFFIYRKEWFNIIQAERLDKRRKYYLILDCETTTIPELQKLAKFEKTKKSISIGNPVIYDMGWRIVDRKGKAYREYSYLVKEVWENKKMMNTAYYAKKIPRYQKDLEKGKIQIADWETITRLLKKDLSEVYAVGAYNSMFDFKKAIPFTEKFIKAYNSNHYDKWLKNRIAYIKKIFIEKKPTEKNYLFNPEVFWFRGKSFPLFCLWGLSCRHLLNNDEYKTLCQEKDWRTASGHFYSTTAEKAYAFLSKDYAFEEKHTALEDATIETLIFKKIVKEKIANLEIGIIYFPFRELGKFPCKTCQTRNLKKFFQK